jgi:hypothetical protein
LNAKRVDEDPGGAAGLIIDGGDGHYFALAWDELLRFRVPGPYERVIEMLVGGADPPAERADVGGFGGEAPPSGIYRLLAEAAGGSLGRARPATRRLGAWAMLR